MVDTVMSRLPTSSIYKLKPLNKAIKNQTTLNPKYLHEIEMTGTKQIERSSSCFNIIALR